MALETPVYENTSVDLVRVQRELLIRQQAAASLPDGRSAGGAALLRYGHGELALDRYQDSGFGTLNVLSNGFISASAVDLRASQAVRLFAGAFTVAEGGPPDTRFGVNAPYVLAQTDRPNADPVLPTHGGSCRSRTRPGVRGAREHGGCARPGQLRQWLFPVAGQGAAHRGRPRLRQRQPGRRR